MPRRTETRRMGRRRRRWGDEVRSLEPRVEAADVFRRVGRPDPLSPDVLIQQRCQSCGCFRRVHVCYGSLASARQFPEATLIAWRASTFAHDGRACLALIGVYSIGALRSAVLDDDIIDAHPVRRDAVVSVEAMALERFGGR